MVRGHNSKKSIPCRWVYKFKDATRAAPKIFKSRLLANGFHLRFGVDYEDTYAPVVRMTALHMLLSVAVHKKMFVYGMDVTNAFFDGSLEHELYMDQQEGFVYVKTPSMFASCTNLCMD